MKRKNIKNPSTDQDNTHFSQSHFFVPLLTKHHNISTMSDASDHRQISQPKNAAA
jgi:hypothetical protein